MNIRYRLVQAASLMAAIGVGVIAMTCAARAIVTMKTATSIGSSIALVAGGSINFTPPLNQPVFLMGRCTNTGSHGEGYVVVQRTNAGFSWAGLNSPSAGTATSGTAATAPGTFILAIDLNGALRVEIGSNTELRIHNTSGGLVTGELTLLY